MQNEEEKKEEPQAQAEPETVAEPEAEPKAPAEPESTVEPQPEPIAEEPPAPLAPAEEKPAEQVEPAKKAAVSRGESFWTPKEVAEKLTCSIPWIYRMIQEGKVKAVHHGRMVKISPEEVQRLIEHGLPLPPKPKKEIQADEEVVVEGKHAERVKPPKEPTEEPDEETGRPGWPLSILFKTKKKEE